MAEKRRGGTRPQMIHCEYCGEDYADSYKRCPFCDERTPRRREPRQDTGRIYEDEDTGRIYDGSEDDFAYEEESSHVRGGKRLAGNTRGGGYGGAPSPLKIIGTVVSLALIVAAVIIVISIIKPLVDKGKTTLPDPSPTTQVTPSPTPEDTQSPAPTDSGAPVLPGVVTTDPPAVEPSPSPTITTPAGQTATGFTLDKSDFSMSDKYPEAITLKVTFIPAGSTGAITWTSSNPDIAAVDQNGKVTHGTKNGQATITAAMGNLKQTCTVRSSFTGAGTAAGGSAAVTPSTSLSLNKTDFTFSSSGDPSVQMKVSGTSSTPVWSIGNTAVATISDKGVVKPVGSGKTTITCKVDGQTLTCTVRCSF